MRAHYNAALMFEDAAERGWNQVNLVNATGRDKRTIALFFSGERQTPKIAKELADALGHQLSRYLIRRVAALAEGKEVA